MDNKKNRPAFKKQGDFKLQKPLKFKRIFEVL